ncbi:ferric reductase like transmembrane component-domain-containing protein [Aspergillus unguis]
MQSTAARQSDNAWSAKYFAIAIGAIMGLFAVQHWLSFLYAKSARKTLDTTVYGLHLGRCALHILYWAISLILLLTNVDLGNLNYVGKRLGWLTLANLTLLTFLALRHTPLAPLSGKSYEKLRPLHKSAGYTTIVLMILHAAIYLTGWSRKGNLYKMSELRNASGAVAGVAMLVIGVSTLRYVFRGSYEVFYAIHILMFILIMIMVGLHRPRISKEAIIIVLVTASFWFLDRLLRLCRLIWFSVGNKATITPLPGAVRIRLSRNVPCQPGSHVFLWVPAVRAFETHPFTIATSTGSGLSSSPEFVIRPYDGFTRDLYSLAVRKPGLSLRCSVDGGYGHIPDFMRFDRILLVAGGSGATFTFAIALGLLERLKGGSEEKRIDFVWVIRSLDCIQWFEAELAKLNESSLVNVCIYVTRDAASSEEAPGLPATATVCTSDMELGMYKTAAPQVTPDYDEKFTIKRRRPDIAALVKETISDCSPEDKVGLGGCGPVEMIAGLRKGVREAKVDGPSVTLHTEEFMW